MKRFIEYAKEHRTATIVTLLLLILFIVGSVARCTAIHAPTDPAEGSDDVVVISAPGNDDDVEGSDQKSGVVVVDYRDSEELEPEEEVKEDIARARSSYTSAQTNIIDRLTSSIWTTEDEETALSFTSTTYTLSTNPNLQIPYAIGAVEQTRTQMEGVSVDETIFVLIAGDKTSIGHLLLSQEPGEDGSASELNIRLMIKDVIDKGYLTPKEAARMVVVDGPSDEWFTQNKTSKEAVEKLLSEWCSKNFPTVTHASWYKTATFNYDEGTIKLEYTLDNTSSTYITLTIQMEDGSLSVKKGA